MPFLTYYTPTYKRPRLLKDCMESVRAQSDADWEHIIIPDIVGIGIDGVFREVRNNLDKIHGRYVYFLQDDDLITDPDMVSGLKAFCKLHENPPVVIARNRKGRMDLPLYWSCEPLKGCIDLGSYITRADIFKRHSDRFGERYEGDYDFIRFLWDEGYEFAWWDHYIAVAQQWGYGKPEKETAEAMT